MTAERDFDRLLATWLDDRSTVRVPEGLLARSLARVDATRQRPGWLVRDRGRKPRSAVRATRVDLRWAAAAVAIVVLAVGAGLVLKLSLATTVGPSSSPPAASPSRESSPNPTVVQKKPRMFAYIDSGLWVVNPDGTGARQLAQDLAGSKGAPSWSADGTRLVFSQTEIGEMGFPSGPSRLYLTDASGGAPRLVDTGCVAPCLGDSDAAFSNDGTRLVFVRTLGGKVPGDGQASVLATIDLSTGHVEELASTTILEAAGDFQDRGPVWSPDGTQIGFTQDVPFDINGPEINGFTPAPPPPAPFVVDADGGNLHRVSPSGSFGGWSPDGTRIVFQSWSQGAPVLRASGSGYWMDQYADIYTSRPDGTDPRRLTSDRVSWLPRWTTDGRIWFVREPIVPGSLGVPDGPPQLWTMDADGGNATHLSVPRQVVDAWSAWIPRQSAGPQP